MPADYVLRAARTAPTNAPTSAPVQEGVSRGHATSTHLPGILVEPAADQYRAGVLQGPGQQEFLFWAANNSSLSCLENQYLPGEGTFPAGDLTVGAFTDGTSRVIVRDTSGRSLSGFRAVVARRGDTQAQVTLAFASTQPTLGVGVLNAGTLTALGGGLSTQRGDRILSAEVSLAAQRFWWARNDPQTTRFAWDGSVQRWATLPGSPPHLLGPLSAANMALSPRPTSLQVGIPLPGTSGDESYAMLRVGPQPSASSLVVSALAVAEEDLANPSFGGYDALVGVASGIVVWDPDFVEANAGKSVWFVPDAYASPRGTGVLGSLADTLFLSPIPLFSERPLLRIGSRSYLTPIQVPDEAALAALGLASGEVGWAASTGRLRLSAVDIAKSDPDSGTFDSLFLGAVVVSDGVACTTEAVPLRASTPLVDASGDAVVVGAENALYVPLADEFGLGVSGVHWIPDGTGTPPQVSPVPVTRPNGSGLVRSAASLGGLLLVGVSGTLDVRVVEFASEVPTPAFKIPKGTAYLVLEASSGSKSRVYLGRKDRQRFAGEQLYFLQAEVAALTYCEAPILGSRWHGPFTLVGDEVLVFAVDGTAYLWDGTSLGAGSWSAPVVAASIRLQTGLSDSEVYTDGRGYLYLQGSTSVGVGWGSLTGTDRDLSGCALLGFAPGAWAEVGAWVPDEGVSLGVFPSPTGSECDYQATVFVDQALQPSISTATTVLLPQVPLEDLPGFDVGVFYQAQQGFYSRDLLPWQDVIYHFSERRFDWAQAVSESGLVQAETGTLPLSSPRVDALSLALPGNGLALATDGGSRVPQVLGEDYIAETGQLVLTTPQSLPVATGQQGAGTGDTFTDDTADFSLSVEGAWLVVADNWYQIAEVVTNQELRLESNFSAPVVGQSWEIIPATATVADVQMSPLDPFLTETWAVATLQAVGTTDKDVEGVPLGTSTTGCSFRLSEGLTPEGGVPIAWEVLQVTSVGVVGNSDEPRLPDSRHFQEGSFLIRVGTLDLVPVGVSTFTVDLSGMVVEYGIPGSPIEGQLNYGSGVLVEYAGVLGYYVEEFSDPALIPQGFAEVAYPSGDARLSLADIVAYPAYAVYLVRDWTSAVSRNPASGQFRFPSPLPAGLFVESTYSSATAGNQDSGTSYTELLSFPRRQVVAERVSATQYRVDLDGAPLAGSPTLWVGGRLLDFGNLPQYAWEVSGGYLVLNLQAGVAADTLVQVDLAVQITQGGDQVCRVAHAPVYRPLLVLEAGVDTLLLEGARSDIQSGSLLRLGAAGFLVTGVSVVGDTTEVALSLSYPYEVGSRSLSQRPLCLISAPLPADFWETVALPLAPVAAGATQILFQGRVSWAPGTVLKIDEIPLFVVGTEILEGSVTRVSVSTPVPRAVASTADVEVSRRLVYPALPRQVFLPQGVASGLKLARVSQGAGTTLLAGTGYTLDASAGVVTLATALGPEEALLASYLGSRRIAPTQVGGSWVTPTYTVDYTAIASPTVAGDVLLGRYTTRSPDTFYVRAALLTTFAGEVATEAARAVARQNPQGGSLGLQAPSTNNWDYGSVATLAQGQDLQDQDRVARSFISQYGSLIEPLEQIQESLTGQLVGDRDGKFRFYQGTGLAYPPPGWEDGITGRLNPRFVWGEVFQAASGLWVTSEDAIVEPDSAIQDPTTQVVTGVPPNPARRGTLVASQRSYVRNDMDDQVLVGIERPTVVFQAPYPLLVSKGVFAHMWQPSVLSRLYPEQALAFGTTNPGISATDTDPGFYTYAREVAGITQSTFRQEIMPLANPVLGVIQNARTVSPRERYPRARIWAYSPVGFPDIDPASDGIPSALVFVLPLGEVPLDAQGLPDVSRLAAQGGDLPDLSTGNQDRATPAWKVFSDDRRLQVGYGQPDGDRYLLRTTTSTLFSAATGSAPGGVYVGSVLSGCILTFTNGAAIIRDGDAIVTPSGDVFSPSKGETLYLSPPIDATTEGMSNPPAVEDMQSFVQGNPLYRVGFDLGVDGGSLVDLTMPGWNDPSFPIQEVLGQHPPAPLTTLEADVSLTNSRSMPVEIPALQGLPYTDSGDESVPYVGSLHTERDSLATAMLGSSRIIREDFAGQSLYPEEINGEATVYSEYTAGNPPATLITTADLTPVATEGSYTPHTGIADVQPYDLLLVQLGQAGYPNGAEGILSVGAVSTHTLEVPRFISPTLQGTRFRYVLENAMVGSGLTTSAGFITWTLTIPSFVLNDGSGLPNGGFNSIVDNVVAAYPNQNVITISCYDSFGVLQDTLVLQGDTITGDLGTASLLAQPAFGLHTLTLTPDATFTSLGAGPWTFTLSVDTYNADASGAGSATGYIDADRLTFQEDFDCSGAQARTTVYPTQLSVWGVTAGGDDACTVNEPQYVNGGDPFTFVSRTGTSAVGTAQGALKVMSFEGHNNTEIDASGVLFAAVPSSAPLLEGTATIADSTNALVAVSVSTGSLDAVQAGDLVVVTESSLGDATTKAGTQLVRHVIPSTTYVETFPTTQAGYAGWLGASFLEVVSCALPGTLVAEGVVAVVGSPSGYNYPSTGRVYVLVDPKDPGSVVSVAYSGLAVSGTTATFTLTAGSAQDSAGAGISNSAFVAAAVAGKQVSGARYLPIQSFGNGVPTNNVVAETTSTAAGFRQVRFAYGAGSLSFSSGSSLVAGTPASGQLGVLLSDGGTTTPSTSFVVDEGLPVYQGVPLLLDLTAITTWSSVTGYAGVACLLPGMVIQGHDGSRTVGTGYRAKGGIWVEPSFARSTLDLSDGIPKVVDADHSLATNRIGFRNASAFGIAGSEDVSFSVRRIRRFHPVLAELGGNLAPLRFLYETRRATVASLTGSTLTTVAGTQLGIFTTPEVNVHPGDLVVWGTERVEIAEVVSGVAVTLRAPGFSNPPIAGDEVQIWLRQAPVPQEQSWEEMLQASFTPVLTRVADPVTGVGGRVGTTNVLQDTGVSSFAMVGEGDYLVVDPAGALEGPTGAPTPAEYGAWPQGDQSVSVRVDGTHVAGSPSQLDDNRGGYLIQTVGASSLTVSEESSFAGSSGDPQFFGAAGQEFAVLPEITGSGLTGGAEAQSALRRTAAANPSNSYLGNYYSIQPFSYRVMRPNGLLSEESLELLLFARCQLLSWLEKLEGPMQADKQGSYYVFQRDVHLQSLELGVASNAYIRSAQGLVQYSPFANTSDCLSILDRRFWILDARLDRETPPDEVNPYASLEGDYSVGSVYTTGSGRPVLPDRIEEVLSTGDALRQLRLAWIHYRANQVGGTLPRISRLAQQAVQQQLEQAGLLRIQQSTGQ